MRRFDELHQQATPPEASRSNASQLQASRRIVCAVCQQRLAEEKDAFAKSSPHAIQAFVNPHGLTFEVLTITQVQGVLASAPSADFSWFAGYAWRVILCGDCRAHLGWRFESDTESPRCFFALIIAALRFL